jgi:hypothetical protein
LAVFFEIHLVKGARYLFKRLIADMNVTLLSKNERSAFAVKNAKRKCRDAKSRVSALAEPSKKRMW